MTGTEENTGEMGESGESRLSGEMGEMGKLGESTETGELDEMGERRIRGDSQGAWDIGEQRDPQRFTPSIQHFPLSVLYSLNPTSPPHSAIHTQSSASPPQLPSPISPNTS